MATPLIEFPVQSRWIPEIDQFTITGAGILNVIGAALDQSGRGASYERRVYGHGDEIPWKPIQGASKGQILVCLQSIFMGKAGQEQFLFDDGEYGKLGKRVMQFNVQLVNRWPTPAGGTTPRTETDESIMDQTASIWADGLVMLSALWSLALHGIRTDPPVAPIVQDRILVGRMQPVGPKGGLGGWTVDVFVQM